MKLVTRFILLFLLFVNFLQAQKSIPKQNPPRLVNDLAGLLDKTDADALEQRLIALDDSTSNQIVVLTVPSLNGEILEDVAVKTFREWGIGNKKTNNGVLLLIALQDKKIRIEVGYGLEGAIPDVVANDIINQNLKPAFREKNYLGGITAAVDNIAKAAAGEYKVARKKRGDGEGYDGWIFGFFFILIIILSIIQNSGRGGGNMMNRNGRSNVARDLFWMSLLSGGGNSGGGSSWGGGGGFGGFGGGSSGGGGASGGW